MDDTDYAGVIHARRSSPHVPPNQRHRTRATRSRPPDRKLTETKPGIGNTVAQHHAFRRHVDADGISGAIRKIRPSGMTALHVT
jgi:hypothetical protein